MKYAVSSQEMKIYDRNTSDHYGVEPVVLMERAALSVCECIDSFRKNRMGNRKYRVLVLAGTGNNGGDGVCVGRILSQRGYDVSICVVGDPTKSSDLLLRELRIASAYGMNVDTFSHISGNKKGGEFDIIVDSLFGIGLSRPLMGDALTAVRYINSCKEEMKDDIFVISVDIPSGINADSGEVMADAVKADKTVTFNFVKLGHILYPGCEYLGDLVVSDVGITKESFLGREPGYIYYEGGAEGLLPKRARDGNKGTNGKVLIVAGSKDISGACILAASACLKAGAGMVRIFTAIENAEAVKALLPEAILDVYEDFEPVKDKLTNAMKWSTQAVVGPGIGCEGKGKELLHIMLTEYDRSMVLDADALNLISEDEILFNEASNYATGGKKLILTPHMGEFSRLCKKSIKECKKMVFEYVKELAKKLHATVICKDARSVIADSNEKKIYINISGNDGMATAGSGDVLSGIVGAFLNMDMSSFEIAIAACYIHGRAGDMAAESYGRYSMVATDIVSSLSRILDK